MNPTFAILLAGVLGLAAGYLIRFIIGNYTASAKEIQARQKLADAERESKVIKKESEVAAKAEVLKAREEFEKSVEARKKELSQLEERSAQRELNLDRKVALIDKKETAIDAKVAELNVKEEKLKKEKELVEKQSAEERENLQRVACMTQDEARNTLLKRMEKEIRGEMGGLIRRLQEQAKDTAEREAQKIIAQAIQRCSVSHANESMTSTIVLPNDDMKGRIIGREGRNIRSLEAMTGVNILIDDTPEAVVISGFDPIRREVAKQALEVLVTDGRIHPARIEEAVQKAEESMEQTIRTAGEEIVFDLGLQAVDPELVRMLGRLKFRTSYSQNVLNHSREVARLMGIMAGEMGLDAGIAKRIGVFHDIGKALDHEVEGGHAVIGADLLKRHGEAQVVVNAVAAHHEEVEAESIYAILASAADAISCSRLGARSETSEIYVKRLEQLENIANAVEGVKKSYAIHAGREIRVVVEPDLVDDNGAMIIARDISNRVEQELQYPGEIRVTVIREKRCVEYAR